jgi:hypothetical protein|tara:strand:- start:50 stop:178 length:129 start_codon:yes stop_codon:yes gene_type:complete
MNSQKLDDIEVDPDEKLDQIGVCGTHVLREKYKKWKSKSKEK